MNNLTLRARFNKFHRENPEVYSAFKDHAELIKASGFKNYSAWSIICVIRWKEDLKTNGAFKINNDFIALYARKLMKEEKHFEGFFKVRKMNPKRKTISSEERRRV